MIKNRFFLVLGIFLTLGISSTSALDIPLLTWENGKIGRAHV